jgi:hypothetical protein
MSDLADEVKDSFGKTHEEHVSNGPVQLVNVQEMLEVPAFETMRAYYEARLLMWARRGYRHHAGATMPTNGDRLLELTKPVMMPCYIATGLAAFSDGVMIGHQENHLVQMCFRFDNVDHLFGDDDFREASNQMAIGFGDDTEVSEFFSTYILGGLNHLAHLTGFAHHEVDPAKVWDLWLLAGTAITAASYLAGLRMGSQWHERDVLDGIEIASEEGSHGPEGETPEGR